MRAETIAEVDAWWAGIFGVDGSWSGVCVHRHGSLGDYPGWYVAWRGEGVRVSAPASATADEMLLLEAESRSTLGSPDFWGAFGAGRGLQLRGPAMHAYLDVDPGAAPGVVDLVPADLEPIRDEVSAQEWDDWVTDDPVHPVGIVEDGRVVAAASLGAWDGRVLDIGVIVVPDRRGHGLAARVGRTCASYAVHEHGVALWRSAHANVASVRTAERIGFTPYVTQLALRPR